MEDLFCPPEFASAANFGTDSSVLGDDKPLSFSFMAGLSPEINQQPALADGRWSSAPTTQPHLISDDTLDDLFRSSSRDPFSDHPMGRVPVDLGSFGSRRSDSSVDSPSPAPLSNLLASNGDISDFAAMIPHLPSMSSSPSPAFDVTSTLQCDGSPPSALASSPSYGAKSPRGKQARGQKSKNSSPQSCKTGGSDEYRTSAEYRDKRARNNEAVRKSRIKSKQKSRETEEEVQELRQENAELKRSLESLRSHLETLQTLRPTILSELDEEMD